MRKPVYNERYYQIQAMLKNPNFKLDIKWLKNRFAYFKVPVPKNGFKKYAEYEKWNKRFWDVWSKRSNSKAKKNAWAKFANKEGKIVGSENYDKYLQLEKDILPPVYGSYLRDLLQKYGFDPKDRKLHEFMIHHVFFGKTKYLEPPIEVVHKRNEKTNKMELFVKILPWTTRDDIVKEWKFIEENQEYYPEHIRKNKPWEFFERDYDIYQAYEKAKKMKKETGNKQRIDQIARSLLGDKYPRTDSDSIRRIHKDASKRLGFGMG